MNKGNKLFALVDGLIEKHDGNWIDVLMNSTDAEVDEACAEVGLIINDKPDVK